MSVDALRSLLSRRPFEPLRIKTSGGEIFEVRHPEMALLARSAMAVVHPDADGSPSDRIECILYRHIASIETIAGQQAA